MSCHDFYIMLCKDALGTLLSEDYQPFALEALSDGYDSPSLRILAVLAPHETHQAQRRLHDAASELDIELPSKSDAVMAFALQVVQSICDGTVTPYEGARKVWVLEREADHVITDHRFDPFIYAASELEEIPVWEKQSERREYFEAAILEYAEEFLTTYADAITKRFQANTRDRT